ncbi:489_t:CDS:1, partial [Gigaspora margarita]
HETHKHNDYKIPLSNIPSLPLNVIQEFYETIRFFIKKKLPLHFNKTGKQIIRIPCSEGQFISIFGPWIQRYLPCKRKYTCFFKGQDADTTMAIILQDTE